MMSPKYSDQYSTAICKLFNSGGNRLNSDPESLKPFQQLQTYKCLTSLRRIVDKPLSFLATL